MKTSDLAREIGVHENTLRTCSFSPPKVNDYRIDIETPRGIQS